MIIVLDVPCTRTWVIVLSPQKMPQVASWWHESPLLTLEIFRPPDDLQESGQ